ncbi:MAG: hypothetical protein PHX68_01940 [Alphaproteobacteria bacterium]|nr:hypothetical protein [Alphaproteobacteria bacterium]
MDSSVAGRLELARAYARQWHSGVLVPVNVSAVTYVTDISDKVLRFGNNPDAAIAACLYKGVVPNTSYRSLLNPQMQEAGDGSNAMDAVRYYFGGRVGGIVAELNSAPPGGPGAVVSCTRTIEWSRYLSKPSQMVLLAEKWENFENRRQEIDDADTARRLMAYCISRFRIIGALREASPDLAEGAMRTGHQLADQAEAYLQDARDAQRARA